MIKISSKLEVAISIFRGAEPYIKGLTIIERSSNSGNQLYLVDSTYGLNFIKIGGISTFRGQNPILGVLQ